VIRQLVALVQEVGSDAVSRLLVVLGKLFPDIGQVFAGQIGQVKLGHGHPPWRRSLSRRRPSARISFKVSSVTVV
jgi:hypothetical protein